MGFGATHVDEQGCLLKYEYDDCHDFYFRHVYDGGWIFYPFEPMRKIEPKDKKSTTHHYRSHSMTPEQIKIADKLGATQYCILDDGSILLVTYICGIMFINRAFYGEDKWLIATNNQNRIWSKDIRVIDFGGIV